MQGVIANDTLSPSTYTSTSLGKTVGACLAITWLNPHVYLDTVVLMGTVSAQFANQKLEFLAGGITASFMFFFALGYGASILGPLFQKPVAWKILDIGIGLVMWSIAYGLVRSFVF